MKQLSMNEALFKERVHQVSQYVARWAYKHGKLSPTYLQPCMLLELIIVQSIEWYGCTNTSEREQVSHVFMCQNNKFLQQATYKAASK